MDVASSSQVFRRQGSPVVATSVDHLRLTKTNLTALLAFLLEYDDYTPEVTELVLQITGKDILLTVVAKPVQIKFCVNSEWLESLIDLNFIKKVTSYDNQTNDQLRKYLESEAEFLKDVVTMDMLDKIVEQSISITMNDKHAKSRIETSLPSWVTQDNVKIAVYHVLSAIHPESLWKRLESDLGLPHYVLQKDFKKSMKQSIKD